MESANFTRLRYVVRNRPLERIFMSAPLLKICQECPAVYVCHVTPNSDMCQAVLKSLEARSTVRRKPPVQQLKAEIRACLDTWEPYKHDRQYMVITDDAFNRMRELSAV